MVLYYTGMERLREPSIYWQRPYGWRAGQRYIERGASAADVVRFEREAYENDLDAPDFLLKELDKKGHRAADVVWICRTREHAQRYGGRGNGQPYKENVGPHALIIATDHEPETGYLVLFDASQLDPGTLEQYAQYRQSQRIKPPR